MGRLTPQAPPAFFYTGGFYGAAAWPASDDFSVQCAGCGARRWESNRRGPSLYRCAYCGNAKPVSARSGGVWATEAREGDRLEVTQFGDSKRKYLYR